MIKIALSGAHGTGKTYIVNKLRETFTKQGITVSTIPSPTRRVKAMGFELNAEGDWQTQLISGILRVVEQREKDSRGVDILLADRTLADEVAYARAGYALKKPLDPEETRPYLDSYTATLLSKMLESDVAGYWDQVFYKPIHPNYVPEADGDRSDDANYQGLIDVFVREALFESKHHYLTLEPDRDDAYDMIYKHIQEIIPW